MKKTIKYKIFAILEMINISFLNFMFFLMIFLNFAINLNSNFSMILSYIVLGCYLFMLNDYCCSSIMALYISKLCKEFNVVRSYSIKSITQLNTKKTQGAFIFIDKKNVKVYFRNNEKRYFTMFKNVNSAFNFIEQCQGEI
jgi:hypothetical protein